MTAADPRHAAAARGAIALQRCAECGAALYPAREACARCQSDRLEWHVTPDLPGTVLARTVLHHSYEPRFRPGLPLVLALVRLDAGPVAVCFLAPGRAAGDPVSVTARLDAAAHPVLDAA